VTFQRISTEQTKDLLEKDDTLLVDIRDKPSYLSGHIKHAVHLDNSNVDAFINDNNPTTPLIIYCYHGNSSQGAADFFSSKGFAEVYSMDGGFEQWRTQYPFTKA
jgi:thiosulfate sulfurtransferase